MFQLAAARRRLVCRPSAITLWRQFQLAAARRRLGQPAGCRSRRGCFNSQPPEGGWSRCAIGATPPRLFQLAAARRRLARSKKNEHDRCRFNSQPPEGGWFLPATTNLSFTAFQLAAARRRLEQHCAAVLRQPRFNSQPPEGGWHEGYAFFPMRFVSTRSRPKAAGCALYWFSSHQASFQLAAARRRLVLAQSSRLSSEAVSTRSRPKAAG